jgi:adenylate cyclase
MFTDLVGYSAITSADEGMALKLLEEHRTVLRDAFGRHGGTVVKTMGDGFLVEFASAVEAVTSAMEAQAALRSLNEGRQQKAQIRIGIHVGDVVHSAGDVLGDAVNVAARLEPLADVGGVLITRQVVDQIERKVGYRLVKVGTRELKNIRYPVELYKVEVSPGLSQNEEAALDPHRIAVLPLTNLSADPNDRYFADGMTEELISTISKITELSVISRTSVMRYKDTTTPIREIGRELSAGTVLEGSLRKAGNKVRITTQLIDAQHDRHLWAQSYDRDMTDIFAVQGDIAEQVAAALRVKLVTDEWRVVTKKPTENAEAYALYLKGRYYWNERSAEGLLKAIRYFKDAIARDPDFALGHSGLADCFLVQMDRAIISYGEGMPLAMAEAKKAVELDPGSAEAHASLGLALSSSWDLAGAEVELKKAIELSPSYATAHHWYAVVLQQSGRNEEFYEEEMKARELDPYSSTVNQGVGSALHYLGRLDEALEQFTRLVQADPDFSSGHFFKAWVHVSRAEYGEAVKEMRLSVETAGSNSQVTRAGLASALARAGRVSEARKAFEESKSGPASFMSPAVDGMVLFDLGDKDRAFAALDRAFSEHDGFLLYLLTFPWCAGLRADPRWGEVERKILAVTRPEGRA